MMSEIIREEQGSYRINLPLFEGPFDLLLYLIRKHDLHIQDIQIAKLTEEYLRYIDTLQTLDIDLAGEFLLMAAELMHIKSQMLLPITPEADEDEQADPRSDLVRRLLEYQRFKDAAAELERRTMLMRDVYPALGAAGQVPTPDGPVPLEGGNVYHLIEAFDQILRRIPTGAYHAVAIDRISVTQRIYEIAERLPTGRPVDLVALFPAQLARHDIVVTFLALLEMARLRMITLFQAGYTEMLYITKVMELATHEVQDVTDWQG